MPRFNSDGPLSSEVSHFDFQSLDSKGADQGFKSKLFAKRLKISASSRSRLVLFVFISFILDLSKEKNQYLSKYLKEGGTPHIKQISWKGETPQIPY